MKREHILHKPQKNITKGEIARPKIPQGPEKIPSPEQTSLLKAFWFEITSEKDVSLDLKRIYVNQAIIQYNYPDSVD